MWRNALSRDSSFWGLDRRDVIFLPYESRLVVRGYSYETMKHHSLNLHFGALKTHTGIYYRIGHFSRGFHWTRVKNVAFLKLDFLDYRMGKH